MSIQVEYNKYLANSLFQSYKPAGIDVSYIYTLESSYQADHENSSYYRNLIPILKVLPTKKKGKTLSKDPVQSNFVCVTVL